uniref:Regulatory protein RecX n=1 Tax=Streptomyces avermitilis TaxID=33903 RepID=A0A499VUX4_STRAX|nr:hypothetical protein SAVMC3_29160 [Streptomyces avermitilis]
MTRRTDWAEYAYPVAPQGRGSGADGRSVGGGDGAYDEGEPYDDEASGAHGVYGAHGVSGTTREAYGAGGTYGGDADGDGSQSRGSRSRRGGRHGDGGFRGDRGEGASRDGGGAQGGRGRGRRRGFGEPAGDPQDGGAPASSRAEKGEPPGDPAERARAICLRLLTGTPRTRKQLADALRKREIPEDVADEVLSRFEEVGLINDSAFADAWVESRHHGRGLARRALARELRTKGVDSTLIDEAVGQLDSEQEEATARELVARKLRSTRGLDRDKRLRRLAGMLARKGYSEGMALRVVRQALEEEGEDTEGLGTRGSDAGGQRGREGEGGRPLLKRAPDRGPPSRCLPSAPMAHDVDALALFGLGRHREPGRLPCLEAAHQVRCPVQAQLAQGRGGQARRVALIADDHDAQVVAGGLGGAVAALGVEAPLQFVAFDDQRAGDQTVAVAQGRVPDVDQQGIAGQRGLVRVRRLHPVETLPDLFQQLVDTYGTFMGRAHCQSSGRSTCSRRST